LEPVEVAAGGDDVTGRTQPGHVLFGGVVDLGVGGVLVEPGVADGVRLRHLGCRARERRSAQLQGPEDAAGDLLGVAAPGDLLDDHACDDVVEGEPAPHDVGRAHGVEHGAQRVVDGQDMGDAAAGGERQHGLAGEGVLRSRSSNAFRTPEQDAL
jgi:hypothetical protein